jgi:hypothetical protein
VGRIVLTACASSSLASSVASSSAAVAEEIVDAKSRVVACVAAENVLGREGTSSDGVEASGDSDPRVDDLDDVDVLVVVHEEARGDDTKAAAVLLVTTAGRAFLASANDRVDDDDDTRIQQTDMVLQIVTKLISTFFSV